MNCCPDCHAPGTVIDHHRCANDTLRRRYQCVSCLTRWTHHDGDPPGHRGGLRPGTTFNPRRLTPSEVRLVLESPTSSRNLALQLGCSRTTIHSIRIGRTHSSLHPDLPRRNTGLSCHSCQHWTSNRCSMGFPDPLEEGVSFASDCSFYLPVPSGHSTTFRATP